MWNIKAIYSSGGHIVTDKDMKTLRFTSELEAKSMAEILTKENKPERMYIVVPERV